MGLDSEELGAFIDLRGAEHGWSAHTRAAYRRDLELWAEHLERTGFVDAPGARAREILAFLAARERSGDAERTLNRRLAALRSFHRHLLEEGLLTEDVLVHLPPPRRIRSLPHYLTRAEVEALLAAPDGPRAVRLRDRAVIEMLYATGVRVSELVALKEGDLRRVEGDDVYQLRVLGKGNKPRVVPVHRGAAAAFALWMKEGRPQLARPDSPGVLLLSRRGKALTRNMVYRTLRRLGLRAGIRQTVTPHLLRHTFATHLVHEGADLRSVQEMLGHANLETTTLYTSVDAGRLKTLHARFHPRG